MHEDNKLIADLKAENERLKSEVRNCQQVIYLRREMLAKLKIKITRLERDNSHVEQAFENYVNDVETEKLKAKIAEDMEVARLRNRVREAA